MTDDCRELKPCPFCGSPARLGETEGCDSHITCTGKDCQVSLLDDMRWGEEGYDADANVIAKWNTRTPTAGDAPKAVCKRDGEHYWMVTDGVSSGRGNTPQGAYAAFNEDKAFNVHKYAALSAPKIDFEGLKKDTSNTQELLAKCEDFTVGYNTGWNAAIDHIAAKYPHLRGE